MVRGVTGWEVDFVVSRGVSFVSSSGVCGRTRRRPRMDICGRKPGIPLGVSSYLLDNCLYVS